MYDPMEIQRETIGKCFSSNGDRLVLFSPTYGLRRSSISFSLYEQTDGKIRHGYKLMITDDKGTRIIFDSGPRFYTRRESFENGDEKARLKKKISDLRLKVA